MYLQVPRKVEVPDFFMFCILTIKMLLAMVQPGDLSTIDLKTFRGWSKHKAHLLAISSALELLHNQGSRVFFDLSELIFIARSKEWKKSTLSHITGQNLVDGFV